MPCLKIMTNLPKSKVPKDFVNKIIPVLARSVKKENEKFLCVICPEMQMSVFGDSSAPAAIGSLESIGNLGPEQNPLITKELAAFMEAELGVPPGRFFLSFYNVSADDIGVFGTTVARL